MYSKNERFSLEGVSKIKEEDISIQKKNGKTLFKVKNEFNNQTKTSKHKIKDLLRGTIICLANYIEIDGKHILEETMEDKNSNYHSETKKVHKINGIYTVTSNNTETTITEKISKSKRSNKAKVYKIAKN